MPHLLLFSFSPIYLKWRQYDLLSYNFLWVNVNNYTGQHQWNNCFQIASFEISINNYYLQPSTDNRQKNNYVRKSTIQRTSRLDLFLILLTSTNMEFWRLSIHFNAAKMHLRAFLWVSYYHETVKKRIFGSMFSDLVRNISLELISYNSLNTSQIKSILLSRIRKNHNEIR